MGTSSAVAVPRALPAQAASSSRAAQPSSRLRPAMFTRTVYSPASSRSSAMIPPSAVSMVSCARPAVPGGISFSTLSALCTVRSSTPLKIIRAPPYGPYVIARSMAFPIAAESVSTVDLDSFLPSM